MRGLWCSVLLPVVLGGSSFKPMGFRVHVDRDTPAGSPPAPSPPPTALPPPLPPPQIGPAEAAAAHFRQRTGLGHGRGTTPLEREIHGFVPSPVPSPVGFPTKTVGFRAAGEPPPAPAHGQPRMFELMKMLDTDKSGVISVDEMKSAPASLKTELAMYIQALGELPEHGLMKMLDTDKSGVISLDEMKSAPASLKTEIAMHKQRHEAEALGELPEHGSQLRAVLAAWLRAHTGPPRAPEHAQKLLNEKGIDPFAPAEPEAEADTDEASQGMAPSSLAETGEETQAETQAETHTAEELSEVPSGKPPRFTVAALADAQQEQKMEKEENKALNAIDPRKLDEVVGAMDTNGDGTLLKSEVMDNLANLWGGGEEWEKISPTLERDLDDSDVNDDGIITRPELAWFLVAGDDAMEGWDPSLR